MEYFQGLRQRGPLSSLTPGGKLIAETDYFNFEKTVVLVIFIVTGRLGENLVYYKTMPVADISRVRHVYVFTTHQCRPLDKVTYINLPNWITRNRITVIGRLLRQIYEPVQLLYYSLKLKPDIINGVYTFPKGFNSVWVSKLSNSKSIVSVLGSIGEMNPFVFPKRILRAAKWWTVRKADAIATKGSKDNNYLIEHGINPEKIFTFNGCIDLARFADTDEVRDIDIVFVGSIYELKGPDRIVKVISRLKKSLPNITAYMVGDGADLDKTKQHATSLGLADNIYFPGFVRDVSPIYRRSKVLILMSRSEGNPNCMLEAMASGCVPVVPDVGNISETIIQNNNGILIDNYMDIDGFAKEILNLLENESFRLSLAQQAKNTVNFKYSTASQAKEFNRIIDYILRTTNAD